MAHRLSMARHADSLVILAHGRVAEQETHAELMARAGVYRQFVEAQGSTAR